uniref:Uncharacterized protein n=1 Tax=Ursus americanus TaxID=9643 RepID=A0A452S2J5_URSAM
MFNRHMPGRLRRFWGESNTRAGFGRMSKSSPSRQGEECHRNGDSTFKDTSVHSFTPSTGDPDSTGNIPRFKALFNKQARCNPNHNSFIGISVLSLEKFSIGCKHSVRFPESKRFSSQSATRNSTLFGGESGYKYFVLSHGAIIEK